ncbi:MAG: alpha/beta hydrolase [Planctomycetota bacterium]
MKPRCISASTVLLAILLSVVDCHADDVREIIYGHKDGLALTYDVFDPTHPNGAAVVFIVSGGWRSKWTPHDETRQIIAPFQLAGYTCFAVRHGSSPRYSIAEAVSDVRRAIRHIRRSAEDHPFDPDRIGVLGMSAGGHLTLMLATTGDEGDLNAEDPVARSGSRIAAGVALVPPSDLTGYVWSTPGLHERYRGYPGLDITKDEAKSVSPLYFVSSDDAPCLIISGGKDELVPPEQGQQIHEKLTEAGVKSKFVLYENAGHDLDRNFASVYMESMYWFHQHLGVEAPTSSDAD